MPFVGLLVMIAIAPMRTPRLWRRHYGKIAAGWSLLTVAAIAAKAGIAIAVAAVLQAMLADYLGFTVMLFALYVPDGRPTVRHSPQQVLMMTIQTTVFGKTMSSVRPRRPHHRNLISCDLIEEFGLAKVLAQVRIGRNAVSMFDPQLVQVMRNALEEVMARVPSEYSTPAVKAYLAECILKTAAQGQISYDGLVNSAIDQIQVALSMFT